MLKIINTNKAPKPSKSNDARIPYKRVTGIFNSTIDDEIEVKLSGDRYITEFRKMANSDAICGAVLLAITKIFQSVEWKTVNDEKEVLKRSLENVNWFEQLDEIIKFLIYGFSVFEITIEKDSDGLFVWSGMYHRPQNTIMNWNVNKKGDLISIEQAGDFGEGTAEISINKCLHFANMKSRTNPKGKSIFRNAYRDWYYKTNIEKIEAIGIERDLTGLPIITPSEDDLLIDEKGQFTNLGEWAWTTVKNIKRNSQEGIVLPAKWEFTLQGSPGERQFDLNGVIGRYDSKIALSMLSQFLVLGMIHNSGSFALADTQSKLFEKAVVGFVTLIANVVNNQFIGAPALALLNDVPKPRLVPVGIDKPNLDELASFLGRLLKYNIITPDDRLEEYLRDEASLPPMDAETSRTLQERNTAPTVDKKNNGDKDA